MALHTSTVGHLSLVYMREGSGEIVIFRRMCKRELSPPPRLRHTLGPNPATTWACRLSPPPFSGPPIHLSSSFLSLPHPFTYLPAFPPPSCCPPTTTQPSIHLLSERQVPLCWRAVQSGRKQDRPKLYAQGLGEGGMGAGLTSGLRTPAGPAEVTHRHCAGIIHRHLCRHASLTQGTCACMRHSHRHLCRHASLTQAPMQACFIHIGTCAGLLHPHMGTCAGMFYPHTGICTCMFHPHTGTCAGFAEEGFGRGSRTCHLHSLLQQSRWEGSQLGPKSSGSKAILPVSPDL